MTIVPLLIIPLAHFFVPGERLSVWKVIGILMGFMGILILFDINEIVREIMVASSFLPKLACITAAACYAVGSIITRRSPKMSQLVFSTTALTFASLIVVPVALSLESLPIYASTSAILSVVYLGVFPTGMATLILVYIIKNAGPSFLSLVNYLVPIWAIFFGVYFNGEILGVNVLISLFLIFLGLFISRQRG